MSSRSRGTPRTAQNAALDGVVTEAEKAGLFGNPQKSPWTWRRCVLSAFLLFLLPGAVLVAAIIICR